MITIKTYRSLGYEREGGRDEIAFYWSNKFVFALNFYAVSTWHTNYGFASYNSFRGQKSIGFIWFSVHWGATYE